MFVCHDTKRKEIGANVHIYKIDLVFVYFVKFLFVKSFYLFDFVRTETYGIENILMYVIFTNIIVNNYFSILICYKFFYYHTVIEIIIVITISCYLMFLNSSFICLDRLRSIIIIIHIQM